MTTPTRDELVEVVREELVMLWGDMSTAVRYAHQGCWSVQCENLAARIGALSRLVGPTGWEHIDVDLLLGGVYERVYRDAGIQVPPVDWDRVRDVAERITAGG